MIPIPLLIALFLAFGVDAPSAPPDDPREAIGRVVAIMAAVVAASFALGLWADSRVRRRGFATARVRRAFARGSRVIGLATVAAFGWIIHQEDWPGLVLGTWRWRGSILADDALLIAPFLAMQLLS